MSLTESLKNRAQVNATADAVWEILGPGYGDYEKWASVLDVTEARMTANGVGSTRSCRTNIGDFTETVLVFDEARRHIAYQADGLPPSVERAVNNWIVTPTANGRSAVEVRLDLEFVPDAPAEAIAQVRTVFGGTLNAALEELVTFAETGQPHPRKLSAPSTAITG